VAQRHVWVRGGQYILEWGRPLTRRRAGESGLALAVLVSAAVAACQGRGPGSADGVSSQTRTSAISSAATASQILAAVQAQPGSPVQAAVASGFTTASGRLSPQFSAAALASESKRASVGLPLLASGAMHLQDNSSGAAVDVALSGAAPVAAQTSGGYVVYPAALAGASILHRALPAGSEDLVYLPTRPAVAEVDYSITLGSGIAGLRLVGGVVEMLDSGGTPRLHVSPPYIVGADGARTDGALGLAGCAADTDPSPPWGRPVTAPGASSCTVTVTWADASISYPAVLDPRWTTTGSMGIARFEHTLLLLSTGKALAAGGRSTTTGTTGLTSAELYDPTSGTWSPTGSMANARRLHSMTQLGSSSNGTTSGKVLVAGGITGTTSTNSAELYSPSAGTWIAAGNLDVARHAHTATLLADGRVLAAGGLNGTSMLTTAALYNPASGAGTWVSTTGPVPPGGIKNHTATLIQTTNTQLNNHVLLVGGNNGSSSVSSVYLFDPVQNAFSTLASIPSPPRELHTAVTLTNTNGKILVAGGKNGSSVLASAIVFDPGFSNGTWSSAGTMNSPRVGHSMTQLPNSIVANGQLLVAGGSSTGSDTLASAELFSGTSTWTVTPSMPGPLQGQQAVLLSGNMVLVAGGLSATTTVQNAAYLYDASFGLGCTTNSQCSSGFCSAGICCNNACNTGTCGACNLAGHLGTCTALTSGTVCRASAGACDVAETCNGTALTCPSDALAPSTTVCRAAAGECDAAETCTGSSASCPSDTKKTSGTVCTDDGNPCTQDKCDGTAVTCQHPVGNAGAVCRASVGTCDVAETCTGTSTTCPADGFASAATVCRATGGECDVAETCTGTSATCPADGKKTSGTACTDDGNVCTKDQCDGSNVLCQHPAGNAGTVCRASAGFCDVAEACTGTSTTCPADGKAPNGTTCNDGNACTTADSCQSGTCTGTAVTCTAQDQCHTAGTCNPSTGVCSNPNKANGTTCSDGNACTTADSCQSGTCTGTAVTCTAQDQCHTAGTCNQSTGVCSNPVAANGTTCSDGNACTTADSCQSGTCTGTAVTCTAQDQCHVAGTCNQSTGICSNPVAANGTTCSDGNACTTADSCQSGTCTGTAVTCTAQDQCHAAGTCNPSNGTCSNPPIANGTTCNDGNACTTSDSCQSGTCTGTAVTCTAQDQCHTAGTCNPANGTCSNPPVANGTTCNDGNACTTSDSCQTGTCTGTAVTCMAQDQCHTAGTCNPSNGTCSNPPVANGTTCSDGNACTAGDSCQAGSCTGVTVNCMALDQCHNAGICDQATGLCSNPAVADGTTCNDGNACTTSDTCHAGNCGGNQVNCSAPDQCHSAGTCDPSTGACNNPLVLDGTPCSDGSACTTGEMCTSGVCGGGTGVGCTGLVLTTSGNSPFASESFLMTANSTPTDLAPGEHPTISATLTDQGLIVDIQGHLTTENAGGASVTIGATSIRLEYFSTVQNQWVPVASTGRGPTGLQLPTTPSVNSLSFSFLSFNAPGVTSPLFLPPETVLAPGATANWIYFDFVALPRTAAVLLTQASRSGAVRFVIEVDSATDGSISLAPIDVTSLFSALPDYPLEAVAVKATLDSNAPVTLAATGPIADGQTSATFVGTVAGPAVQPRSAFSDDSGYVEYLLTSAGVTHKVKVTETLNGGSSTSPVNLTLPSAIPIVDFGFQPPPAAVAGQPVHYDLDFRNDGTGVAGPLTLSYLLSGTPTGASSPPGQLGPAQSSNGSIDFTAPVNLPTGPLDDQIRLTWHDRVGNLYGPTTQTAASCPIGACTSIASGETLTFSNGTGGNQPHMSMTLSTDVAQAMAGDTIHMTAVLTNTGLQVGGFTSLETVTNTGFTPFVVQGFRQTFEYFSAAQNAWIPFVEHAEDAFRNVISDPSIPDLGSWFAFPNTPDAPGVSYPNSDLQGTTINPGATAQWFISGGVAELPPDVEQAIENGDVSGGVRSVFQLDVSSGPAPDPTVVDVTANFAVTSAVDNLVVQGFLNGPSNFQLISNDTGALLPGQSRTFTGAVVAPMIAPPDPSASDQTYYYNLVGAINGGYGLSVYGSGTAGNTQPEADVQNFNIGRLIPILQSTKYGPPQATAGLTAQYKLLIQNVGNVAATFGSFTETVNGAQLPATILSMPATTFDPGQADTLRFTSAVPPLTPAGPLTDDAKITWTDRNGNVYGPLGASFTTNLLAGHPEGYLLLSAASVLPEHGTADVITVTAENGVGSPVPGVPVHFVISGFDPKTVDLVTGPDGTASFSYSATNLGKDSVVVTGTVTTVPVTATMDLNWVSSVSGTPCVGHGTPLDVMLVIDGSPSMFTGDNVAAAQAASDTFISDLDLSIDQIAVVTFSGGAELDVPFTTDATNTKSVTDGVLFDWAHACDGFCAGGTNYPDAFRVALTEFQNPSRHRDSAQPLMIFISDGGNNGGDYSSQLAALKAFGVRIIAVGMGPAVDANAMRQIATSPNDYFDAPTTSELAWVFANVNQDTCSTIPPLVSAGGNQSAYHVRLPDALTLQGEAHGSGTRGDLQLATTWTELSGPGPVTFSDASAPVTQALFTAPGTYVLQLEATDGFLSTADQATITVDPAPSLTSATLVVALSSTGPLMVGSPETMTATLLDGQAHPIPDFFVQFIVTGANPGTSTASTNAAGVATLTYTGAAPGTDVLQATALGATSQLAATPMSVTWTPAPPGSGPGSVVTQGWIGAPAAQTTVRGLVPVTVAAGVTVASATVSYWPANAVGAAKTLATNASGGPGAALAVLDTTVLPNGSYVIDVNGTDGNGVQQDNAILVAVGGDYKPGREVVEVTDYTFPIAGLPITIGRRYDSLNKDKVGDFGNGWALTIGHPDLQVDQANNVTITMPDGRRSTFIFEIVPVAVGNIILGFWGKPLYVPQPGVFGKLTSNGCSILTFDPNDPSPICIENLFDPEALQYAPTTYVYTDQYGTVYTMGSDGTLKSIQDRNQNILTFAPDGISSPTTGKTVTLTRDDQGRITKVVSPSLGDVFDQHLEYDYAYDASGNLTTATRPAVSGTVNSWTYTYDDAHRLLTSTDPLGHPARTSTFDAAGRLATDTDALANVTRYVYDVAAHKTTITYPDSGVVSQTFDDGGLLLSQTDQLGRTTTHVYDANQNEVKRTDELGEATMYTYDGNGNQTSAKNALGEKTTTTYNAFSQPLTTTDAIGNTTTIAYDGQGLPTSFADSMGPLATFTSSEHGLPTSVTDVGGNIMFLNYDGSGNLTERTDRLGRTTGYGRDGFGRQTSKTTPRGAEWDYGYDARGNRISTTDPIHSVYGWRRTFYDENGNLVADYFPFSGQSFNYTYDPLDHLTETRYTDGTTTRYTRDFRGNVLTETDEGGKLTIYTYDLAGQLLQTTYADGTLTTQGYDVLGRLTSKTDERGGTTTYAYEPGCGCAERMTSMTDALGRTTSMTYDGLGRKTSTTDAAGRQTSYAYDLRGHLIETDYPDGSATRDTYDPLGRRTASTDQNGATTHYGYDAEGQLGSVTDPLAHITQYAYDADGNMTAVTDANGHVTTYAYDLLDEKTQRTLPLGMSETFTYDALGEQVTHTDFRGKMTTMTYGPRKRLTSKIPDPSLNEPTVTYTYNDVGARSTMTDASGTTTYGYDQRNRLLTKATPEGTVTYTYDASGNVASIDSSNANGTSVGYAWDAANQLSTVTDNRLGGMTTAAYTATGRPVSVAQPNGVGVSYAYDSLDRVTSMAWKQGAASALASWSYTYSPRGQRLSSTELSGREAAYGYDVASRLTTETITADPSGASGNGAVTYNVDPVGNRSSRASTLASLGSQSFSYDSNDELTTDSYDPNGNTTTSGGHSYAYDFENRLVSKDGGAVTIVYDGDGNRVAKSVSGVTTKYLVDELNPTGYLQVMDEVSGGAVQVRYTFGNMLVSQTRTPNASPSTSFYGYDAHGNVAFLTDVTGASTDRYTYDSWGNVLFVSGSTPNTRLYDGEELDPDLGLVNLRARQYRPVTGRFMTADSVPGQDTDPTSFNRYLFSSDDPVLRIDPTGHDAVSYGIIIGAVAAALLVEETIRIGNDRRTTTISASGAAVAAGETTACNLAKAITYGPTEIATTAVLGVYAICAKKVRCTDERKQELDDEVNDLCKTAPSSCKGGMSCAEMADIRGKNINCLKKRQQRSRECFPDSPDRGHENAESDTSNRIANCQKLIELAGCI
jgi:RHS repeat-associated protein